MQLCTAQAARAPRPRDGNAATERRRRVAGKRRGRGRRDRKVEKTRSGDRAGPGREECFPRAQESIVAGRASKPREEQGAQDHGPRGRPVTGAWRDATGSALNVDEEKQVCARPSGKLNSAP